MPKSPTNRRPATVAALHASALRLFAERGFHATSVSDIVERAGLTRGAFYSNFRDKEELFLALYDVHTDRLLADLAEVADHAAEGEDPVSRMVDHVATRDLGEQRWFIVSMEFTLHAARRPELAAALARHEDRLTAGLAELLERSLRRESRVPEVPAEELARLVVALTEGLTALRLTRGATGEDPVELARRAVPHLVRVLSSPTREP